MTNPTDLPAALRAHARGLHSCEAAVELLIGHASWLRRTDFLHHIVPAASDTTGALAIAPIDWSDAIADLDRGDLPCSGGEARMLRIAASLADGIPVDLRDALTGLDSHNAELVSHAVNHATRHH